MLKTKLHVRARELQRRVVRFCGGLSNRDLEYDFAYRAVVGPGARVLDVGGCESILPLRLARRGCKVTVADYRDFHEQHANITSIKGDFLANRIEGGSFDYVTFISAIEHVGFGSYGAPVREDGDFAAMAEARRIAKPDGRIVLTVPFASKDHIVPGFERWYSIERIRRLFSGLHVLAEEYYVPGYSLLGRVLEFVPASLAEIQAVGDVVERYGCQCVACFTVSRTPRDFFGDSRRSIRTSVTSVVSRVESQRGLAHAGSRHMTEDPAICGRTCPRTPGHGPSAGCPPRLVV